jgi:putative transposase
LVDLRRHGSDARAGATGEGAPEHCVGSLRSECLDWILIVGQHQLEEFLRVYIKPSQEHRPHPSQRDRELLARPISIERGDRLGGLLHEYHPIAA